MRKHPIDSLLLQHYLDRFCFYDINHQEYTVTAEKLIDVSIRQISENGRNAEIPLFAHGKRGSSRKHKSLFPKGANGKIDHDYYTQKGFVRVVYNAVEILSCLDNGNLFPNEDLKKALNKYYSKFIPYGELISENRGMYIVCIQGVGFSAEVLAFCHELLKQINSLVLRSFIVELDIFIHENKIEYLELPAFIKFYDKSNSKYVINYR